MTVEHHNARPTIKLLGMLDANKFADRRIPSIVRTLGEDTSRLDEVDMTAIDHPLLKAARSGFKEGRVPSEIHRSATISAGQTVYEIKDPESGQRAAGMVFSGVPWVVYAGEHNYFHNHVASILKKSNLLNYAPTEVDWELFERAEERKEKLEKEAQIFGLIIQSISDASSNGYSHRETENGRVDCEVDSESVPGDSIIDITYYPRPAMDNWTITTIRRVVSYMEKVNEPAQIKPKGNRLDILFEVPTINLVQVVAAGLLVDDANAELAGRIPGAQPVLHVIQKTGFTQALIQGKAVKALCGVYFVPMEDGSASKPVCEKCRQLAGDDFPDGLFD